MKIIKEIKNRYDNACNEIIEEFCKKQEIEFDYWVSDKVGGIASFSETWYFDIYDILYDLTSNQPKGTILRWQDESSEYNMGRETPHFIGRSVKPIDADRLDGM